MSTSSNGTSLQSPNRGIPAFRKETPDTGPARPPASNANRADKPTNGPRRRILVIGAVIGVLGLFFGIRYWMYASGRGSVSAGASSSRFVQGEFRLLAAHFRAEQPTVLPR